MNEENRPQFCIANHWESPASEFFSALIQYIGDKQTTENRDTPTIFQ